MRNFRKNTKEKKVRSHVKWTLLIALILVAGIFAEYMRLELENSAVTVTAPFRPQYSVNEVPQSSIDLVASLTGISTFQAQYHTDGAGQKIALIDSGIDLSHSAFCENEDGSSKVAVYYDYTEEGLLYTEAVQQENGNVLSGGIRYRIGGIYNHADTFYLAFLDLNALVPHILDTTSYQVAVLVTAVGDQYDCVYLDTNQNCDFTDEQPLYCYQNRPSHIVLHQGGIPIDVAVTHIADDGRKVQLTADTLGHGTFLAGIVAANGTTYHGLAPQAQLYVYKIFDHNGNASQIALAQAIQQAIADEVDCINLSLSIPQEETILPALTAALQLAQKENIPVIAAAGNYGPGQGTLAYPAREDSVIGVGSFAYPEQYLLDRAIFLEEGFVADYSGRGIVNSDMHPLLVAPSGVISTVPGWYQEQYLYDYGTSISAAVVTAAVCHLQESIKHGCLQNTEILTTAQIKNILAVWTKDMHDSMAVQGYGVLSMGALPSNPALLKVPSRSDTEPTIYQMHPASLFNNKQKTNKKQELFWQFEIPQGQSQSWQLQIPADTKLLEISLLLDTERPVMPLEHLIAMGRCRMYVYRPDGKLIEATEYIGASYGSDLETSVDCSVWYPQEGIWEVVITSADNLTLYNHFETTGMLYAKATMK